MLSLLCRPKVILLSGGHCINVLLFSDMIGHDEHNACPDERELDDEGVEIGSRSCNCFTQNVQTELIANFVNHFGSFDPVQKYVAAVAAVSDNVHLEVL